MKTRSSVVFAAFCLLISGIFLNHQAFAEDGYELWLRYQALPTAYQKQVQKAFTVVTTGKRESATLDAAKAELTRAFQGFTGAPLPELKVKRGALVIARADELSQWQINPPKSLVALGPEGYWVGASKAGKTPISLITANSDIGLLYGSFALLQALQQQQPLAGLELTSSPKVKLRVLNHWDNLDGTVERGYAGASLWDWWRLPDILDPRYVDYARANASVGINGTVLNNVNSKALSLDARYLAKAAAVADVLRPYGIKVYLSARFNAPMELGGLTTADPLNADVQQWWITKTSEIYRAIPDFGGFLVKANSEGQPGPQDYGRSHADGANMLAKALAPHGGVVMWRAFVYSEHDAQDRAKQAYNEFQPLDGKFAENVLLQVKNGPIDFQPREPFHPLFGAMPNTPLMLELQITKEYLGFSSHLAYLGSLYQEVLQEVTFRPQATATVADVVDGTAFPHKLTGIAGVANIGRDRNWSGSVFDQANWFAFARLAWNPNANAEAIAKEWLQLTFNREPKFVEPALAMMMASREAVVDYMTPLGLAHLMATGHHYGPAPWVADLARPEWNPAYYHRADKQGIGFDRTASGSNAVAQYAPELAAHYSDLNKIHEKYLLWFHHLSWDYPLRPGQTLWQALVTDYDQGVTQVAQMQNTWQQLQPYVDSERFNSISARLNVQLKEAAWWRDASLAYFSEVSGRALPQGVQPPEHDLEYYKALSFPYAPGN